MMIAQHPFGWLPEPVQGRAFVALFVLTVVVMASLQALGGPLITDAAPSGIVSFELAGDLATSQEILESWGPTGRVYAGVNLGLDYLFLFAYSSAIALGCVLAARRLSTRVKILVLVGVILAWLLFVAGLLDALEKQVGNDPALRHLE